MKRVNPAIGQDEFAVDARFVQPICVFNAFIEKQVSNSDPDPSRRKPGKQGATGGN